MKSLKVFTNVDDFNNTFESFNYSNGHLVFTDGLEIPEYRISSFIYNEKNGKLMFNIYVDVSENPDEIVNELMNNINAIAFVVQYTDNEKVVRYYKNYKDYKIEYAGWEIVSTNELYKPISIKCILKPL